MKFGFLDVQSLDQVMAARKGATTGFDYLRIGLSLAVLSVHCLWISYLGGWRYMWSSWMGGAERSVLPAFFVLSGFLVLGSLFRTSIPQFLALRVVRLMPALGVEVGLTALGLGLFFTTLSTHDYLRSGEFHAYFLNIIGDIHYTLPGVFDGQPLNVQLWTIPFELECYMMVLILAVLGVTDRRKLFVALLLAASFAASIMAIVEGWPTLQSVVSGRVLVFAFLFGNVIYLCKDAIPYNKYLFIGSCIAAYILFLVPHGEFLGLIPLSYATIYFGVLRLPRVPLGDLSYGVFLFHFPVAVTLHRITGGALPWWGLTIAVTLVTGIFAMGSWTLIENPLLRRKRVVLALVDAATSRFSAMISRLQPAPSRGA